MEQVKVEPEDPVEDDPDGLETMTVEHEVIIKKEETDFVDEEGEEAVDDPLALNQNQSNSGELAESEIVDVKLEPTSSYEPELERNDEWTVQKVEDNYHEDEDDLSYPPVSTEMDERAGRQIEHTVDSMASSAQKTFQCPDCDYAGASKKQLATHVKRRHGSRFLCDECDYSASRKDLLKLHMQKHCGQLYKCPLCTFTTWRNDGFSWHLKKHTSGAAFQCPDCSYATFRKEHLNLHARKHSDEKLFRCAECSYACARRDHLKRHMTKHTGAKWLKCVECEYVASRRDHLSRHMRTHTGQLVFRCSKCDYKATRRDHLTRHERKHAE